MELSELRVRLDQMTERIISRLKDRSRFPLNDSVYRPGGVQIQAHEGTSLLEFSLLGLERYHASLGRYAYPDQHPLVLANPAAADAVRTISDTPLPAMEIAVASDLLDFYQKMLRELCAPGEDPGTFGETAYIDADLLQLINERVNVGRYVAQAKLDADPQLGSLADEPVELNRRLRDRKRESDLLESVRAIASRYQVDADVAARVFGWIVDETTHVEVAYLQGVARKGG